MAPVRDGHRISVALVGDDRIIAAAPVRDGRRISVAPVRDDHRISSALVVCSKYNNYENTLSFESMYILPIYILVYL